MWSDDAVWECPLMPQPLKLEGREQICACKLSILDSSPEYKVIETSTPPEETDVSTAGDLLQYMSYPRSWTTCSAMSTGTFPSA